MSYFAYSDQMPEWAARVPTDWDRNWLKWSVDLSARRSTEQEREVLPYIANEHIASWTGQLLVHKPEPSDADSRRFQENDVLFNKLRPYLAKVYHATFDGVSSGELLCLRPSQAVKARFLFYVLVSKGFVDTINAETFGAKMPRADWSIVGHQPLPLPSIDRQDLILRFLDQKTEQIDRLVETKRALLEQLAERRLAFIARAVSKGLNPHVPTKPSGVDWLGDVPTHWDVLPLRRVTLRVATGRTPPSTNVNYFTQGRLNWFTPGDFSTGIELHESSRRITPDAIEDGICILFPPGTVFLVGIGATLGKVAVSTAAGSANQQVNAITPGENADPYFMAYFLHGFRNEVRVTSHSNTLGILNQDRTKSLLMPVPPLAEQKRIAVEVRARDSREADAALQIEQSIGLLQAYRSALITAAVTGQIGTLRGE